MYATEQAVGDLRASAERMAAQLTEQITNQNLSEASHQQLHTEVLEMRRLIADLKPGQGSSKYSDKSLLPEAYAMEKSK